jgi:hypothetical protein
LDNFYVYQYTNINSLALILKNKTIRFSALSSVDDSNEAYTRDYGFLSDYVFVSCWTIYANENIALWNMYSKDMSGIRIGLPAEMFQMTREDMATTYKNEQNGYFNIGSFSFNVSYDDDIYRDYTLKVPGEENSYRANMLGKYKEQIWSFQKEFRYRLFGYRCNATEKPNFDGFLNSVKLETKPNVRYVDIPVKEGVLDHMQILLGPKYLPGTEEIVRALINNYVGSNNKVVIIKSNLRINCS